MVVLLLFPSYPDLPEFIQSISMSNSKKFPTPNVRKGISKNLILSLSTRDLEDFHSSTVTSRCHTHRQS